jgi:hypothetical protein
MWPIGLILDGNWDLALRRPVDIAGKIPSMKQRFLLGLEWEETDLFRYFYPLQFVRKNGRIKGATSIPELAEVYRRVYDPLYEKMRVEGFRTPSLDAPNVSFVYVHIDRYGQFMFTTGGNHRLGMALALKLSTIPVRVLTRHLAWQATREAVKADVASAQSDHPDLRDLVPH